MGSILSNLKPGGVVLVHGTCRENLLIQPELQRVTIDGQRTATIHATDARRLAIQVLGREVTIKGLTVTGACSVLNAVNRGVLLEES